MYEPSELILCIRYLRNLSAGIFRDSLQILYLSDHATLKAPRKHKRCHVLTVLSAQQLFRSGDLKTHERQDISLLILANALELVSLEVTDDAQKIDRKLVQAPPPPHLPPE